MPEPSPRAGRWPRLPPPDCARVPTRSRSRGGSRCSDPDPFGSADDDSRPDGPEISHHVLDPGRARLKIAQRSGMLRAPDLGAEAAAQLPFPPGANRERERLRPDGWLGVVEGIEPVREERHPG